MYGIIRPMTVLIKWKYCGNDIAIATAATPDPKRNAVPIDATFVPSLMERSNFSIRRTNIQKLYVPKNAPKAIPANIDSYGENPQPKAQRASKKRYAFFCKAKT